MSDEEKPAPSGPESPPKIAEDPFTKIRFNPHKGLDMVAPIRVGVLKEIGKLDETPEQLA